MAVGIACCAAFLAWTTVRLATEPTVRLQRHLLKRDGRLRPAGFATLAVALGLVLLLAQSALVRLELARARGHDSSVRVSLDAALRPDPEIPGPEVLRAAESAAYHYGRADRIGQGGFGLLDTPEVTARRAWMAVVLSDWQEAERHLGRMLAQRPEDPRRRVDLARIAARDGRGDEAISILRDVIATDPSNVDAHRALAAELRARGDAEGAVAELVVVVNLDPGDTASRQRLVEILRELGRHEEAARYRARSR